MDAVRTCTICEQEKPLNEENFYTYEGWKGNFDYYCRPCRLQYKRDQYHKNKVLKKVKVENIMCPSCEIIYPLTVEYWHKKGGELRTTLCKACTNERQALFRERKRKAKEKIKHDKEMALKEQVENQYKKMLLSGLKEDRQKGLQLNSLKLLLNHQYKIRIPKSEGSTSYKYFTATLIQICDRHLVFKSSSGICESFLKADLLLDYKYKEVN